MITPRVYCGRSGSLASTSQPRHSPRPSCDPTQVCENDMLKANLSKKDNFDLTPHSLNVHVHGLKREHDTFTPSSTLNQWRRLLFHPLPPHIQLHFFALHRFQQRRWRRDAWGNSTAWNRSAAANPMLRRCNVASDHHERSPLLPRDSGAVLISEFFNLHDQNH
ncbi:hypothetical protein PIB30_024163 [Stylosanthes scabra]|uniref:Uncharacterized protein n=1 Tax=Stylosanthes scabra TaxID=79078 RepID=A0ABU6Y7W3_9FABA|nr:hypothetical protein [Stylosanthes scabra]